MWNFTLLGETFRFVPAQVIRFELIKKKSLKCVVSQVSARTHARTHTANITLFLPSRNLEIYANYYDGVGPPLCN